MSSFRHLCLCSTYPCGNCVFVYLYFACLHVAVRGCLGSISVQCLVQNRHLQKHIFNWMSEPKSYLPWCDCDLLSLPCYCSCHFLHGTTFPFLLKAQTLCFKAHQLPNFASASTFHPQSAFLIPWPVVSRQDLHSHGLYSVITGFTTCSGFPCGTVAHLPRQETLVQYVGQEVPLEEGVASHSSVLAWRIPWTGGPGRLQPMGSQRVGPDSVTELALASLESCLFIPSFYLFTSSLLLRSCLSFSGSELIA